MLLKQIRQSFELGYSDVNRKRWARHVMEHDIAIEQLLPLIYDDSRKVSNQFAWLLSDICEIDASKLKPILEELFLKRKEINNSNFSRSLSKYFRLVGIPESIEGEVADKLFEWLNDPKSIVSTKSNCMLALYNLSLKYPEFQIELKEVIEEQLDKTSISFQKKARKILQKLS